jgi:hypothetical protein
MNNTTENTTEIHNNTFTMTYEEVPTTIYSQAEKDLKILYPNLTQKTWEMVNNVNRVMKIMLWAFGIQAVIIVLGVLVYFWG